MARLSLKLKPLYQGDTFLPILLKDISMRLLLTGFSAYFHSRPSARRQSTVSKAKRSKQADDHLEMDGTSSPKSLSLNEPVLENGSTSMETSVKNEDNRSCSDRRSESRESGKPSMGRPSRAAARKVQSYKEIPLSVKMRRPE